MSEIKNWNGARIRRIDLGQVVQGIRCEHPECQSRLQPKRVVYEVDGGLLIGSCCIRKGTWTRLDQFLGEN